ncbi:hypothetical protein DXG03_008556 [Asterophora parasitica]|uniref:Uncharacterized protein n=1 Tax=Asterophora parasitica TaxID=117018 RepID=A0A9P7G477_9AGAR|nr:hypothetical protein DXG03_008556 [Asterophora parasitica]
MPPKTSPTQQPTDRELFLLYCDALRKLYPLSDDVLVLNWRNKNARSKAAFLKYVQNAGLMKQSGEPAAAPPTKAVAAPTPHYMTMLQEAADEAVKRERLNAEIEKILEGVVSMNPDGSFNLRH